MELIVIHVQVHVTAKDGTVLIVGNLHTIDSTYYKANGLQKHKVPGNAEQAERFKQQVVKNTLDKMLGGRPRRGNRWPSSLPRRRETWSWSWSATST